MTLSSALGLDSPQKTLGQTLGDARDSHTWGRGGNLQHPGLENSLRLPPDSPRKHEVRRNNDDDDDDDSNNSDHFLSAYSVLFVVLYFTHFFMNS